MQGETAKEVDAEQDRRKPSNPQSSDEGHLIEQGGDEENEHRSSSPSPSSPRTQTQAQTGARDPRISSLGIGTGSLDGLCEFCKKYGPVRQQYITAGAGKPALLVTKCEVSRHDGSRGSHWITAESNVFDVSSYIDEHPGGRQCLLNRTGGIADAMEDFRFHSKTGKKQWNALLVAKLIPCDQHQGMDEACAIL